MGELAIMKNEDINVCIEIYRDAFEVSETEKEVMNSLKMNNHETYFKKCISENDKYAYCYKHNGEIIGFITAWDIPSVSNEYDIFISCVAIAANARKKGHGRKMLGAFLETVTKEHTVWLETRKGIPAYKMYKDFDFDDDNTTRMVRSLKAIELKREIEKLKEELAERKDTMKKMLDEPERLENLSDSQNRDCETVG